MLRRTLIPLALLLVAACDLELPGLTALDADLERARTVVAVHCNARTLAIGQLSKCLALNADSAIIQSSSVPLVRWATSAPLVVQVDVDGTIHGVAPGTAVVTAWGSGGSSASDTIRVE